MLSKKESFAKEEIPGSCITCILENHDLPGGRQAVLKEFCTGAVLFIEMTPENFRRLKETVSKNITPKTSQDWLMQQIYRKYIHNPVVPIDIPLNELILRIREKQEFTKSYFEMLTTPNYFSNKFVEALYDSDISITTLIADFGEEINKNYTEICKGRWGYRGWVMDLRDNYMFNKIRLYFEQHNVSKAVVLIGDLHRGVADKLKEHFKKPVISSGFQT